jgi:hypothetical protein
MMAVEVQPGAAMQAGRPKTLFQTHGPTFSNVGFTYAVTPDGQRFLVNTRREESSNSPPIHIVVNWTAALR